MGVRARIILARNGPALDEAGRRKPTPASETGPLPEVTVNAIAGVFADVLRIAETPAVPS